MTATMIALLMSMVACGMGNKVAFDVDDTIASFGEAFGKAACAVLGRDVVQVGPIQFSVTATWDVTWEEALRVFSSDQFMVEMHFMQPKRNMLDLLLQCQEAGIEVVIITARGACDVYTDSALVKDITDLWLKANGVYATRVVHTDDKAAYMAEEGGYIALFDDAEKHRAAAASVGIAAFAPID